MSTLRISIPKPHADKVSGPAGLVFVDGVVEVDSDDYPSIQGYALRHGYLVEEIAGKPEAGIRGTHVNGSVLAKDVIDADVAKVVTELTVAANTPGAIEPVTRGEDATVDPEGVQQAVVVGQPGNLDALAVGDVTGNPSNYTVAELLAYAAKHDIDVAGKQKKADLVAAINEASAHSIKPFLAETE